MLNTTKKTVDQIKSLFTIPNKIVTYTSQIKGMDKVIDYAISNIPIQNTGIIAGSEIGRGSTNVVDPGDTLLQETGFNILQEDSSRIIL